MKLQVVLLFGAALPLATPALAAADLSGDYKVTMHDKDDKQTTQLGKIFLDGTPKDRERAVRMEMQPEGTDQKMVFLTRPQDETVFMIMPESKTFFSMSIADAADKAPEAPGQGVEPTDFKEVGRETVNGIETVVKEAPLEEDGETKGTIRIYAAPEFDDEPIKSEIRTEDGVTTTVEIENPSNKRLPDSLFRVPEGFTEAKLPSVGQIFEELGKDAEKEQQKEAGRSLEEKLREGLRF